MKRLLVSIALAAAAFTTVASEALPLPTGRVVQASSASASSTILLPEAKGRKGSKRVGGSNSKGKGSRYVGGRH